MRGLFRPYNLVFLAALLIVSMLWNEARDTQESLQRANSDAMQAMKVLSASDAVLSSLADIETGARGYAITSDPSYLDPYSDALVRLPVHSAELHQLLRDQPENAGILASIDAAEARRVAHSRKVVAAVQAGNSGQAAELVREGAGKRAMDEARKLLAQLNASERKSLEAGNARLEDELGRVRRNMAIGAAMALLLMVGMMIAVNATLDARRRATRMAREGEAHERDQHGFLRAVVDTDDNLIFTQDAEGRIPFCNAAFADLIGLDPGSIQGRHPGAVDPQGLLAPLLERRDDLMPGEGWRSDPMLFLDGAGGERWFQLLKRSFGVSDGRRILLTVGVDVSSRLQVERLKDEFVSTVSHELRTPLTSIRGALDMVNSGVAGELPDGARRLLGIAHKNTERLVRLINDLLDVQKLESGQLRMQRAPHRLRPLLEQSIEQNAPYGREFDVRLFLEPGVDGYASVDPDRFAQMMANLLSNAIKHSRKGDAVDVALEDLGTELLVSVTDHGAGIPEHFRAQIFQRFAQADSADQRARGGTGLGLAITNSLVGQMDGRIGFDSAEGAGTRFHVRFPKIDRENLEAARTQAALSHAHADAALPATPRILHVEDDIDMRQVIRRKLEKDGLRVDGAGTLAGARALLARRNFDLVILDLILPDGDGKELLPELEARVPPLPVIVFSAKDARLCGDGVIEHLVKSRQHEDHLAKMVLESIQHLHAPREEAR